VSQADSKGEDVTDMNIFIKSVPVILEIDKASAMTEQELVQGFNVDPKINLTWRATMCRLFRLVNQMEVEFAMESNQRLKESKLDALLGVKLAVQVLESARRAAADQVARESQAAARRAKMR